MQLLEGPELPWRLGTVAALGAAALAAVGAVPDAGPTVAAPAIALPVAAVAAQVAEVATVEPPPVARPSDSGMVFRLAGSTYVKLADLSHGDELPRHGTFRHVQDAGIDAAIAALRTAVPAPSRFVVDGHCEAAVTGQAIIARLTGDAAYAGLDSDDWSVDDLLERGNLIVAAKLDGCDGAYARDAAMSPVVLPEISHDFPIEIAAKDLVKASAAAAETQHEWRSFGRGGHWYDDATWTTLVLRHPRTGTRWVSVQAHQDRACGDPTVNLWGLFRINPDGTLTKLELRTSDLESIEQLIDIDGDGELEVVGRPWLGFERMIETADGELVDQLALPFYGCPC